MRTEQGFTLIELLVVVAILGILTVNVIPNFTQAQVRSKVARVLSEQNTIGVAVELYATDHAEYPPDWIPAHIPSWPFYVPHNLSTPIGYLTGDILVDPFPAIGWPEGHFATGYRFKNMGIGHFDYSYSNVRPGTLADQQILGKWVIYSCGPTRQLAIPAGFMDGNMAGDWLWLPYDATNGIISRGCIIHSQKFQDARDVAYDFSRFP